MKILLVSMPSIHVKRWIENLKLSSHDIYWFDVISRGDFYSDIIDNDNKFIDWQKRKVPNIKGEFFLSKKFPKFYSKIQPILEVTVTEKLETIINEIKPDVVHSFEMQSCCYPILKTMKKFPSIKWIYSCWGSDLYYYQQFRNDKKIINKVLKRIDYLITDCNRDYKLAQHLGFNGGFLGVIPGGGGFKEGIVKKYSLPFNKRKTILIKGYEHKFGRALNVIKALENIQTRIKDFEIVVFGAHSKVLNYINKKSLPFIVYNSSELEHKSILELMGQSLIFIGNSFSDGVPNTLLEAIALQAFPIQSNPGNATKEYIENRRNGLLIKDVNDVIEIQAHIVYALNNLQMIENSYGMNSDLFKERLEYKNVNLDILDLYYNIENIVKNQKSNA